jgi:MraZ protein
MKVGMFAVFRGVQYINMDAKGRMAMPARHRDVLVLEHASQLIATIDTQSRCLHIYPLHTWEEFESKLQAVPVNKAARRLTRLILGHASELEFDANGRVRLPSILQEYAGLEKKLVLVGQGEKFELWSESAWQQECEEAIADASLGEQELPEAFANLVL